MKYALLIAVLVLFGAGDLYAEDGDGVPAEDLSESPAGDDEAVNQESLSEGRESIDESTLTFEDESEQGQAEDVEGLTSFGAGDFIRMVLVLALVVLSIYVLFYFLKRAGGHGDRSDSSLRLLGTTTLQGSRAVHLVEVGGRVFLVGSAEQSVNLISELQDQETIDQLLLEHGATAAGSSPFGRRTFSDFVGDMFRGVIPAQGKPVTRQNVESASQANANMAGTDGKSAFEEQTASDQTEGRTSAGDRVTGRSDDSFISRQRERLQHL